MEFTINFVNEKHSKVTETFGVTTVEFLQSCLFSTMYYSIGLGYQKLF